MNLIACNLYLSADVLSFVLLFCLMKLSQYQVMRFVLESLPFKLKRTNTGVKKYKNFWGRQICVWVKIKSTI